MRWRIQTFGRLGCETIPFQSDLHSHLPLQFFEFDIVAVIETMSVTSNGNNA